MISEQYRHHYKFRTLTETGNMILILSAGNFEMNIGQSCYETDITTYKMAKSYVYLTNVNCSLINFNNKSESQLRVELVYLLETPYFRKK